MRNSFDPVYDLIEMHLPKPEAIAAQDAMRVIEAKPPLPTRDHAFTAAERCFRSGQFFYGQALLFLGCLLFWGDLENAG